MPASVRTTEQDCRPLDKFHHSHLDLHETIMQWYVTTDLPKSLTKSPFNKEKGYFVKEKLLNFFSFLVRTPISKTIYFLNKLVILTKREVI